MGNVLSKLILATCISPASLDQVLFYLDQDFIPHVWDKGSNGAKARDSSLRLC